MWIALGIVILCILAIPMLYFFEGFIESQKRIRGKVTLGNIGIHLRNNLREAWIHLHNRRRSIPLFCRIIRK